MDSMNRMQSVRTAQARQMAMQSQMTARKGELEQELAAGEEKERLLESALAQAQENLKAEEARYGELKARAQELEEATKAMLAEILAKQKSLQEGAQSAWALRPACAPSSFRGLEGYQHSVRNALQFAKRQGFRGAGRGGHAAERAQELETAMDMALGAAMQNIVTDGEQDAKRLIEYLRQTTWAVPPFAFVHCPGPHPPPKEREVLSMEGAWGGQRALFLSGGLPPGL